MNAFPPTVGEAVRRLRDALRAAGVGESGAKAEWAVAHLRGCRRLELRSCAAAALTAEQGARWTAIRKALLADVPLQYALGETEFRGRIFATDARALIPRPETEGLVEAVMDCRALWRLSAPRIADIGTGSGCVAVTLAVERPPARIHAVDLTPEALALAGDNARRHGVGSRIEWRRGDLLDGFVPGSLDAVVANLPYVRTAEIARLERQIRAYEPRRALDGGADGLGLIRGLIGQAPAALGRPGWIFLEIGEDQGAAARALLTRAGFGAIVIARDLAGHDRVAAARIG